ncbi:MAG: glycosyltransferase [Bacteroides sp.]|nr:glycosyltransferase [Bacteroides sp.]MCM1378939.1 glycosyltransferase [Bacteroides sp.]MCM1445555.1 glycosyltransferase [Prevotella sp.]
MIKRKKKILFTLTDFSVGGVEKSLLSLLKVLPAEDYDLHVAMLRRDPGELIGEVPPYVTVHCIEAFANQPALVSYPKREIPRLLLTLRWRRGIPAAFNYVMSKIGGNPYQYDKWLLRNDSPKNVDREFDLVVDYPGPPGERLTYYAMHHVNARHRAIFLHFDLGFIKWRRNALRSSISQVDKVFCVSEATKAGFCSRFPEFASKAVMVHNVVDTEQIKKLAEASADFAPEADAINTVQVGRLSYEKGQDRTIECIARLKDRGVKAVAHFVGDGAYRGQLAALAEKLGVGEQCRFYGNQPNPYPFMRRADVVVQPSRHEGFGLVTAEAVAIGIPVVTADYSTAEEQLKGVVNARIVPMNSSAGDTSALFADAVIVAVKTPRTEGAEICGDGAGEFIAYLTSL